MLFESSANVKRLCDEVTNTISICYYYGCIVCIYTGVEDLINTFLWKTSFGEKQFCLGSLTKLTEQNHSQYEQQFCLGNLTKQNHSQYEQQFCLGSLTKLTKPNHSWYELFRNTNTSGKKGLCLLIYDCFSIIHIICCYDIRVSVLIKAPMWSFKRRFQHDCWLQSMISPRRSNKTVFVIQFHVTGQKVRFTITFTLQTRRIFILS
jgi:hypothetical protein